MRKGNGQRGVVKQLELFKEVVINYHPGAAETEGISKMYAGASKFHSLLSKNRALTEDLLSEIMSPGNVQHAYEQVRNNRGSSGVDGMTVPDLSDWYGEHWQELRSELLGECYEPQAVLGVKIPKASGGDRLLGIPTVIDRLVQQSIHQQLQQYYEPLFSDYSYGYRPGRSAHDALLQACEYVSTGREWVVDMDLKSFFDGIHHDRLLQRLSKGIGDKRVLRLIRKYLGSGILLGGLLQQRVSGTPQGGPLSPLLSNIVLDELDKELEQRGHSFVRYADDCNIYVKSRKAGERVLSSITRFIEERLKLEVNEKKSGVRHCSDVRFLGYTILADGCARISSVSVSHFKRSIRAVTKRNRGRRFSAIISEVNRKIRGWLNYYRLATRYHPYRDLDSWIRRRLRCYRLRQRKRTYSLFKFLRPFGEPIRKIWNALRYRQGWWAFSNIRLVRASLGLRWFQEQGLYSLVDLHKSFKG